MAAALLALLAAACAPQPRPTGGEPAPPAAAKPSAEPSAEPAPQSQPPKQMARKAPRPKPPPKPTVDARPERFIGLQPATLEAELGAPTRRRREPPAEIWQYRGSGCVLDLFLYDSAEGWRSVHLEARDDEGQASDPAACLRGLLQAARES